MAKINLRRSLNEPTQTPQGNSTLRAYNQQGQPVYVERGQYYPGVSMTAPNNNINSGTVGDGALPAGQTPPTSNPQADTFNTMLLDIFKQSQGVTAIDLLKKRRDLEKTQADAVSAPMPEGLSPAQQNAIISSKQRVSAADISENDYQIARAEKAIFNFEDLFYKTQQFGQEFAEKMAIPDAMVQNYKRIIEADSEKLATILSTLNDKSKQAVINALDYNQMGKKTDLSKRNVQVMGEYTDPTSGESKKRYGYFDEGGKINYTDGGMQDETQKNVSGLNIIKSPSDKFYDMSTYAKDPVAHTKAINDKIQRMGKFNNITDVANYINKTQSNSPIQADMIVNASEQYEVGWEELTALAQHESFLGTSPVAQKNNNVGGITWSQSYQDNHPGVSKGTARPFKEGGYYVKFNSLQEGIDAVAEQLSNRITDALVDKTPTSKFTPEFYRTDYGQKVLNNEQQYYTNFLSNPTIKTFVEVQNKAQTIRNIVDSSPSGAEDLALVFEFMKSLDPSSVVRETEYDTASKVGNPFKRVAAKIGGYVSKGQILPEEVRQEFYKISKMKLNVIQQQYNTLRDQARKIAKEQGLNPEHIAPDLTIDFDTESDLENVQDKEYPTKTIIYQGKKYNVDSDGNMTEIK